MDKTISNKTDKTLIILLAVAALTVRLALAFFNDLSHPTDMIAFRAWGEMVINGGFRNFYGSPYFTDYPPGYMYVLAALAWIRQTFEIGFDSLLHNFIIKMPAMLADVATVVFIYMTAIKFHDGKLAMKKDVFAACAALLYALNPAIIINSAVWGQVDSIHTLLLVISIYLISQRKMLPSVLIFSLSIVVKPQSFMLSPIYLFVFFKFVFGEGVLEFNIKRLGKLAGYGLICFAVIGLMLAPFIDFTNLPERFLDIAVFRQYADTFTTYPFITHNAYNLYSLLGLNTGHVDSIAIWGISYNTLGTFFLVIITLFSFYLLYKKNDTGNVFFVGAMLVISTFVLSVRMHERYGFPALAMLLLAYVTTKDKRILYLYLGFSASFFLNYIDVLAMSLADFNRGQILYTARIFAIPTLILFVCAIYLSLRLTGLRPLKLDISGYKYKDAVICGIITLFYAIFAFTNLGNMSSAQTHSHIPQFQPVVADFGNIYRVHRIQYMLGPRDTQTFNLEFSHDGDSWFEPIPFTANDVFAWGYMDFEHGYARFVRITPTSANFNMIEMAFRDQYLNLLPIAYVSQIGQTLFDEQHLVPLEPRNYMHSAFFDEIYHPRTAYEFIHGLDVFEWTHPPLGKVIMSWGISIFGMTPFGWRFMGAFFGVLMLPLIYVFAKKIFEKSKDASFWAAITTFIFAFDFMHYVQTRLATIDTYVVFFIIGMYYCMYIYTRMNFFHDPLRKTLMPLLGAGIFAGLAIASKWQGGYGVIGLAVIFFGTIFVRYMEYKNSDTGAKTKNKEKIKNLKNYKYFWKYTLITCAACVGFFIAIPLAIYLLSYIPYYATGSLYPDRNFFAAVFQNQIDMYNYHAHLVATHPFASSWWQWIINYRPIWLYSNYLGGGMAQGISSFGNPLVWWGGFGAFIYCAYAAIKRRDGAAVFLVVAYLAQILPWIFVPRIAFIYHYFPNVPFIAIMITYMFKESNIFNKKFFIKTLKNRKIAAASFAVAVFALFVLFYPVLTGIPINREFVSIYLRWFPSWVLLV